MSSIFQKRPSRVDVKDHANDAEWARFERKRHAISLSRKSRDQHWKKKRENLTDSDEKFPADFEFDTKSVNQPLTIGTTIDEDYKFETCHSGAPIPSISSSSSIVNVAPLMMDIAPFAKAIHSNNGEERVIGLQKLINSFNCLKRMDLVHSGILQKLVQWVPNQKVPMESRMDCLRLLRHYSATKRLSELECLIKLDVIPAMLQIFKQSEPHFLLESLCMDVFFNFLVDSDTRFQAMVRQSPLLYLIEARLETTAVNRSNEEVRAWMSNAGSLIFAMITEEDDIDAVPSDTYLMLVKVALCLFKRIVHPDAIIFVIRALASLVKRAKSENITFAREGEQLVRVILNNQEVLTKLRSLMEHRSDTGICATKVFAAISILTQPEAIDLLLKRNIHADLAALLQKERGSQLTCLHQSIICEALANMAASPDYCIEKLMEHDIHAKMRVLSVHSNYEDVREQAFMFLHNIIYFGNVHQYERLLNLNFIEVCVEKLSSDNVDSVMHSLICLNSILEKENELIKLKPDFEFAQELEECFGDKLIREVMEKYNDNGTIFMLGEMILNQLYLDDDQVECNVAPSVTYTGPGSSSSAMFSFGSYPSSSSAVPSSSSFSSSQDATFSF